MKKIKFLIILFTAAFCFGFKLKLLDAKSPQVFIDNYTVEVKDGQLINCRKIKDMGVVVYFTEQMKKYDIFNVEIHRTGEDGDAMIAYKNFVPTSKEFLKKYDKKESVKLNLLNPNDLYTSDFQTNTLMFLPSISIDHVICMIHELQHCNFYVVVKGYLKTGKTDRFGDIIYDKGTEESPRSVVFRNWEKK